MNMVKAALQRVLASCGYGLVRLQPPDIEKEFLSIHEKVKSYTMTSFERQYALYAATKHIVDTATEGALVECGVWKGGSTMVIAETLLSKGVRDRKLYLYDTFAGMSEPSEKDVNLHGNGAAKKWQALNRDGINEWDYASLDEVRANVLGTGYPAESVTFVKGKVEDTIPGTIPEKIALLRLDTDWYESTKHELEHLFPRLVPGGVIIIDDYGHWKGARDAVDEYVKEKGISLFLNRIDYTGRAGVKIS